jgi:hypothetical protein
VTGTADPGAGDAQYVIADNGVAYGTVGADIHIIKGRDYARPLYFFEVWQPLSKERPGWLRQLPSRMLDARYEVVGFAGRSEELAQLRAWRDEDARLAIRWLHAPGGQGKTRLAAELARGSSEARWMVTAAIHGPGNIHPAPGSQNLRLRKESAGRLVIIDYADRWNPDNLSWLLSNSVFHDQPVPVRVLMIARTAAMWPAVCGMLDGPRMQSPALPSAQYLVRQQPLVS